MKGDVEEFRRLWVAVRDAEDIAEILTPSPLESEKTHISADGIVLLPAGEFNRLIVADRPDNVLVNTHPPTVHNTRFEALSVSETARTIAVVSMAGWSEFKHRLPEYFWQRHLCLVYDNVMAAIRESDVRFACKYLDAGVLISCEVEYVTEALNTAIRIQERLIDPYLAVEPIRYTVGVATGPVVEIAKGDDGPEVVGIAVDRALELHLMASGNGIFVDVPTVSAINASVITSRNGQALGRNAEDYVGGVEKIFSKESGELVSYHEILWHRQRYGVLSSMITSMVPRSDND